jgi:acetyl esterase/lipase
VALPADERNDAMRTAAVRETHHRAGRSAAYSNAVDDSPDGRVLPLPPAPDAIELRHLRAFAAVAEELNFARAAARLYLSAPALSRQIRVLERLVGCDLFRRSTHRVELTLAGSALLEGVRRVLIELDDAVVRTRSVGGELSGRMARLWAPAAEAGADFDLQEMRDACESMLAQSDLLPEITVRSVSAAGLPSLVLTAHPGRPATVLYLHGGGYVTGSAFGYRPLAGAIAAATGASVLVPEYRLAPEHPFPAALHDAARAYRWMLDQGVPPDDVIVCGDSSGAGLVMSLLLEAKEQGRPMPGAAILLSPWLDLTARALLDHRASEPPSGMTVDQAHRLAAYYLDGHPVDDPLLAPLEADLTGLPPLLVQAGTGDPLLDDARRLAERAQRHGVEVTLELYPVATHVFHLFWSFLPEAVDAVREIGTFTRRGPSPAVTARGGSSDAP